MKFLDLTNMKFGRLTAIKKSDKRSSSNRIMWDCICDCGNTKTVMSNQLRTGYTKSCGCLVKDEAIKKRTTFMYKDQKIYKMWSNMINRCHGKNKRANKWYKDKGIVVYDEWRDALKFIKWAFKNGYKDGKVIHRKNELQGYNPENCILIYKKEHYKIHSGVINKPLSNNTTGYRGVCFNKKYGFYTSMVVLNKKRIHIGCFSTAELAYEARINYIKENT